MAWRYLVAHIQGNRLKTALLIVGVVLSFVAASLTLMLREALPGIAQIPLNRIGASVIVQTEGVIPDKIAGIVLPHSNGPVYARQYRRLSRLGFVKASDRALYFWDFTSGYKSVTGYEPEGSILANILTGSLGSGRLPRNNKEAVISYDYSRKYRLGPRDTVSIARHAFAVSGVLKSTTEAQIMPADTYVTLKAAQGLAASSADIMRNYKPEERRFVNVVMLRANPADTRPKDKLIKSIDKRFLVYSEQIFSEQIKRQSRLLSAATTSVLFLAGGLLLAAFVGLVLYMVRSRQSEIAILRAVGWTTFLVRTQFLKELAVVVLSGLVAGFPLAWVAVRGIAARRVSIEVPWEISAKPHFMMAENSINRVITAKIPIVFDWRLAIALAALFLAAFLVTAWITLGRIKRVSALDAMLS